MKNIKKINKALTQQRFSQHTRQLAAPKNRESELRIGSQLLRRVRKNTVAGFTSAETEFKRRVKYE